jgi:predicted DNA-binding antitoxin AbrB/MazE fold protein
MSKAFNALYENGVFKPLGKVRLKNRQRVKLTVVEPEKLSKRVAKSQRKPYAKSIGVDVSCHPAQQIVGLFKSGVHDLAKSHDRHLYR